MIRVGVIGAGKMGLSHLAILGAHPGVEVVAICDTAAYLTSALRKYTGVEVFKDYRKMFDGPGLDCVLVATPTSTHYPVASEAIERGLHVFVEKPLCLDPKDSLRLVDLAKAKKTVSQVGYHNRFIGTFIEARRLARAGAIGEIYHIDAQAFGQVVIKPKTGATWRSSRAEGGGCLHDYASHVVDLMNFVMGSPEKVSAAQLRSIYSRDVEDAVYAMMQYPGGASGQLTTNWSDDSYRKMSTTVTIYGTKGKIIADRQECKVYLHRGVKFETYETGWTTRYITDLQQPVSYYLRGEEYSAQIDAFVAAIDNSSMNHENLFASASETDRVISMIAEAGGASSHRN